MESKSGPITLKKDVECSTSDCLCPFLSSSSRPNSRSLIFARSINIVCDQFAWIQVRRRRIATTIRRRSIKFVWAYCFAVKFNAVRYSTCLVADHVSVCLCTGNISVQKFRFLRPFLYFVSSSLLRLISRKPRTYIPVGSS